ncbi:hypothetical protein HK096_002044 [Nowakowskiella sp. JEL0078]|nr:hypothetical protein HK096_002044 [Nowakowskiella sp. JEL0078]
MDFDSNDGAEQPTVQSEGSTIVGSPHNQLTEISQQQLEMHQQFLLSNQKERENDLSAFSSISQTISHSIQQLQSQLFPIYQNPSAAEEPEIAGNLNSELLDKLSLAHPAVFPRASIKNLDPKKLISSPDVESPTSESHVHYSNNISNQTTSTHPITISSGVTSEKRGSMTSSISSFTGSSSINSIKQRSTSLTQNSILLPHGSNSISGNYISTAGYTQNQSSSYSSQVVHDMGASSIGSLRRQVKDISKKLIRYLSWSGYNTRVFNVGNKRRTKILPNDTISSLSHSPTNSHAETTHDAAFFDPNNVDAAKLRDAVAMEVLDELIDWLNSGGKIAVHDATNSTIERREMLKKRVESTKNIRALFIESICTDPQILTSNILMKTKSPDYAHMPQHEAIADFTARMRNYERSYATIGDEEENSGLAFIKIFNVGRKVVAGNIKGVNNYMVNSTRRIRTDKYLPCKVYNTQNRIGGDPPLTENGRKYARALAKFMKDENPYETNTGDAVPILALLIQLCMLGLPAVLIILTARHPILIFWMFLYIFSLPIWNFVLPLYAFWNFDNFSWGQTRRVAKSSKTIKRPAGRPTTMMPENNLKLLRTMKWHDWMKNREEQVMNHKSHFRRTIIQSNESMDDYESKPEYRNAQNGNSPRPPPPVFENQEIFGSPPPFTSNQNFSVNHSPIIAYQMAPQNVNGPGPHVSPLMINGPRPSINVLPNEGYDAVRARSLNEIHNGIQPTRSMDEINQYNNERSRSNAPWQHPPTSNTPPLGIPYQSSTPPHSPWQQTPPGSIPWQPHTPPLSVPWQPTPNSSVRPGQQFFPPLNEGNYKQAQNRN